MDSRYLPELLEFVRLFVVKEKRLRFEELLSNPKRFDDGLDDLLNDDRHLDPAVIEEIPGNEQTEELIYKRLRKHGFREECLMIDAGATLENLSHKPTREALEGIWNHDVALYCPVSKVGYFEGHEGWRYILRRIKH